MQPPVTSPEQIFLLVQKYRAAGKTVGLVLTMGALHAGHLSLIEAAKKQCDIAIATIFVNPTQFAPHEDLAKYPRTLEHDCQLLASAGCDLVFTPSPAAIYPPGCSTFVEPPAAALPLEGIHRPGHFRGVTTVVLKLFNMIPAQVAYFGQKDFQQALVLRRMVADLNVPIQLVICPIIREADGLALSSRNRYLSPAERQTALSLSQALNLAQQLVASGELNASPIVAAMQSHLKQAGVTHIEYVALADPETLAEVSQIIDSTVALIAAFVGHTRLIDNSLLSPPTT